MMGKAASKLDRLWNELIQTKQNNLNSRIQVDSIQQALNSGFDLCEHDLALANKVRQLAAAQGYDTLELEVDITYASLDNALTY